MSSSGLPRKATSRTRLLRQLRAKQLPAAARPWSRRRSLSAPGTAYWVGQAPPNTHQSNIKLINILGPRLRMTPIGGRSGRGYTRRDAASPQPSPSAMERESEGAKSRRVFGNEAGAQAVQTFATSWPCVLPSAETIYLPLGDQAITLTDR